MKKQLRSSICLLLATMIWGSTFVAQSVGMDHIGPFTFQAVRCALAVIGLLPVIAIADRKKYDGKSFFSRWADKKLWKAGILCGIPLFLACNLQQLGLVDTDAGKSAFLTAMYIVIVPIFGIFLKKKPSKMIPISVALAVAGLYCLSCVGVTSISTGDLLLLGCAFMFAVQIIFVDIFAVSVDALRLNTIQALVCAVLSGIVMIFAEEPSWQTIIPCWLPLAYAGFLSMGAAYSLQIIGQQHLQPSAASLIMSLESVFAVLCGCLILHERLTNWEIIGCVLVFAAVILSQIPDKKKEMLI
ncbi:MAG: DMT family transporter [Oscillospiraceae bacterium]|nr:DMT family transporter [Oscillospiraceae bacterium]